MSAVLNALDNMFTAFCVVGILLGLSYTVVLFLQAHPPCADLDATLQDIEACYADKSCYVTREDVRVERITRRNFQERCTQWVRP